MRRVGGRGGGKMGKVGGGRGDGDVVEGEGGGG